MTVQDDNQARSTPPSPSDPNPPYQPTLPARFASAATITFITALCRTFLYGLNTVEVTGLDKFLDVLDQRADPEYRQRGLITVSNHVSILDDPIMWGVLPLRYSLNPANHRWGLGAHDICFKNKPLEWFFYAGHVLPTHRIYHSEHGGLFQPTMAQTVRLLSSQPFKLTQPDTLHAGGSQAPSISSAYSIPDPFTDGGLTYTSNGHDTYDAPSRYTAHRHSWVHVFPEAMIHQQQDMYMRYFKWGVSRMILESEPMPEMIPIFIDGTQKVMAEDRGFPRFLPRPGVTFKMAFGDPVDMEARFGDLREKWRDLVRRSVNKTTTTTTTDGNKKISAGGAGSSPDDDNDDDDGNNNEPRALVMGELTHELKYGDEAVALRIETTRRVREEVAKLRSSMGYPDEKPGLDLAETWARDELGDVVVDGGDSGGKQQMAKKKRKKTTAKEEDESSKKGTGDDVIKSGVDDSLEGKRR